jgi:hypothetical protein
LRRRAIRKSGIKTIRLKREIFALRAISPNAKAIAKECGEVIKHKGERQ